jgi:hypothetical protein
MKLTMALLGTAAAGPGVSTLSNPCIDSTTPQSKQPWCNSTLPIDVRVADMVSRMTLKEKIPSLNTNGPPIPSLGLAACTWPLIGARRRFTA